MSRCMVWDATNSLMPAPHATVNHRKTCHSLEFLENCLIPTVQLMGIKNVKVGMIFKIVWILQRRGFAFSNETIGCSWPFDIN